MDEVNGALQKNYDALAGTERRYNSWEIRDPYGYGYVFTAEKKNFVENEDESNLFCHAFLPNHDDQDRYYDTFLLIINKKYYFVRYDFESIIDDKNGLVPIRNECIMILEESFIEESVNRKETLKLLKKVISMYEESYCCLKVARERKYRFKFTYYGREI